jgi:glycosyltransferase involved in cell wall biosynthesis
MKIAFLIATMDAGGAQRVAAILCNRWVAAHSVALLTYHAPGEALHYQIDPGVKHFPLALLKSARGVGATFAANLRRIARIRRKLRAVDADVVICFMTEANVVGTLAAKLAAVPVVIAERIHPGHHPVPMMHRLARRVVYPMADALVVQTQDIADWYRRTMRLEALCIPNPVEMAKIERSQDGASPDRRYDLISVGRLERQKGFDLLIEAFKRVAAARSHWTLTIYGEGPQRPELEARIEALGLGDRVRLPGVIGDVPARLAKADLYVHAARYEGFPNAVVEALAADLCVVATDCPGATAEILEQGRFGILVPPEDVEALADALDRAMADEALRSRFQAHARDALHRFDASVIAETWLRLCERVVGTKHRARGRDLGAARARESPGASQGAAGRRPDA